MSDVTRKAYLCLSQRQTDKWQVTDCTGTTHWTSTEETGRDATPAVFASKRIKVNSWLAFFVQLPTWETRVCKNTHCWNQLFVMSRPALIPLWYPPAPPRLEKTQPSEAALPLPLFKHKVQWLYNWQLQSLLVTLNRGLSIVLFSGDMSCFVLFFPKVQKHLMLQTASVALIL